MVVPPSSKSTVPAVTGEPELLTEAWSVTELPAPEVNDGFALEVRVVVVDDNTVAVVMLIDHPPDMDPVPSPAELVVT
jgi:hypothetical protein